MYSGKVEICGVNTASLRVLSEEEKSALLRRAHDGDTVARNELVEGNLRLVLSVLQRFATRSADVDDLFQVGVIGLMKAIDHFDTSYDVKFSTYAVPMIIGEIRRYLRDNNAIRVSRSVRDLAYRALAVRDTAQRDTGTAPSVEAIAGELSASPRAVAAAMEAIAHPVSLYDTAFNDGDDTVYVIDQLRDDNENDENWVENIALRNAYNHLTPREKAIIDMRYYNGKTQMEVAEAIGISQAQVSRLEKNVLEKIKREL